MKAGHCCLLSSTLSSHAREQRKRSLHSQKGKLCLLKRSECRCIILTAWVALSPSQRLFRASCSWGFSMKNTKVFERCVGYCRISQGKGTRNVSLLGMEDEDSLDRFRGRDLKTTCSNSWAWPETGDDFESVLATGGECQREFWFLISLNEMNTLLASYLWSCS